MHAKRRRPAQKCRKRICLDISHSESSVGTVAFISKTPFRKNGRGKSKNLESRSIKVSCQRQAFFRFHSERKDTENRTRNRQPSEHQAPILFAPAGPCIPASRNGNRPGSFFGKRINACGGRIFRLRQHRNRAGRRILQTILGRHSEALRFVSESRLVFLFQKEDRSIQNHTCCCRNFPGPRLRKT